MNRLRNKTLVLFR